MKKVTYRPQEFVIGTSAVRYCTSYDCDILEFPSKREFPTIHNELLRSYTEVADGLKYGSMLGDAPSKLSRSDKIFGIALSLSVCAIMVLCLCLGSIL